MHEVLHGHPTRNALVNEAFVFLPIGLVWPFRRFKALHLRHHADERLTDPFDDPESYYQALWMHEELPAAMKTLLKLNNTMIGRFILGPWLSVIGFFLGDFKLVKEGDRAVRLGWALHFVGLAVVLPIIAYGFGIPLWLYVLGPAWIGLGLISIRTFAEHQWSEHPGGRTIIVERSPLSFLFLNNNLHFVHHRSPTVAWYRLPRLFQRAPRRMGEDEQRLRGAELFRAAEGVCLQGERAGRASGAAPRAGAGRDLPAARARQECQWARHRAGSCGTAEEIACLPASRICTRESGMSFIAALPMYEWPETRADADMQWKRLRPLFRHAGSMRRQGSCDAMPTCRPCQAASVTARER